MRKTGQQLVEQGIITNVMDKENVQQVGVDLNLIRVQRLIGAGFIPKHGKTVLAPRKDVPLTDLHDFMPEVIEKGTKGWYLTAGVYDITLEQGCKIPSNASLEIIQRSSGLRNGLALVSSMFDPGFETENIGTIIRVENDIMLEYGCRIGQAYSDECHEVNEDLLYNGQFQKDQQRLEK